MNPMLDRVQRCASGSRHQGHVCGRLTYIRLATDLLVMVWALFASTGGSLAAASQSASNGVLFSPADSSQFAGYPRVIRLAHSGAGNGTLVALFDTFRDGTDQLLVYQSADNGHTWTHLSTVADSAYAGRMCCATLFELPLTAGDQAAGTLLLGESGGAVESLDHEIKVFRSADHGQSWSYLSSCAKGQGGLWEPAFSIDRAGHLVCTFSDERRASYNQFLGHVVSTDGGTTWGTEQMDVGVPDGATRPGMATIVRLSASRYVMSFEVCGTPNCPVHIKTSVDGDHWGDPTDLGARVQTRDGDYAGRTPYVAVLRGEGATATLLLTSKDMFSPDDLPAPDSRQALLINHQGGSGVWSLVDAPVTMPGDGPDCANYSSALLPDSDGNGVFELAAVGRDGGGCEIRYGHGPITAAPAPAATRLPATPRTAMDEING